ncbi:helix-turn-helix domain-containing protein [Labrys portucalensis]|uniref:Helix-turn-helix domain-containing protein n=1 Tax=Labrys neptuniae TaxID=376174 RepID=A0ABV6Z9F4_9HYPH
MKQKFPNRLKEVLERVGVSGSELARRLNTSRQQIARYSAGEYDLSITLAASMAKALGVKPEDLIAQRKPFTEIVGLAGAGPDGSVMFATGDGNYGEFPAPANSTDTTVGLEVRGHSMTGIANDGWLITYDQKQEPTDDMLGEPCVVWLANGQVLVKNLERGSAPGLFHLVSSAAPIMRDQVVEAAALITNIIPRRAAEKYIRRDPNNHIEELSIDG